MRPLLHPFLVNGRTGDPALYVETLFEKGAIMFDLGDLSNLPPRKIQRLEHIFVSHAHIDHFFGFDRLLRFWSGGTSSSASMDRPASSRRSITSLPPIAGTWSTVSLTTLFSTSPKSTRT